MIRALFKYGLISAVIGIVIVAVNYGLYEWIAYGKVFDSTKSIPRVQAGLVLGTSPTTAYGRNRYFIYRIDAAADLYRSGKVEKLIVSGDNGRKTYNEPEAMRDALIKKGVPEKAIVLDYAGFDTYDSVKRAKMVFGVKSMIIVTQDWHAKRAMGLASIIGIENYALVAEDVDRRRILYQFREVLSRVKITLLCLLRVNPKYPGPPENITFKTE